MADPPHLTDAEVPAEVASALDLVESVGVEWSLLRDPGTADDVDVLVERTGMARLRTAFLEAGFSELPSLGRGSHRFFVRFDEAVGRWVGLDVVTELAFGRRFELRTNLEHECLRRRRSWGRWYRLDGADAFWTLLLHCLLDKRSFAERHRPRLRALARDEALESPLAKLVGVQLTAPSTATDFVRLAARGAWTDLLTAGACLAEGWRRADRSSVVRAAGRAIAARGEWASAVGRGDGVSVAILGVDGAGKSTLVEQLGRTALVPTRSIYMGLWRNDGALSRRRLLRPLRPAWRPLAAWTRYLRGRWQRTAGRIVVFDRYTYDPYEPPGPPLRPLKELYLRLLERSLPAPDLVLLLDVPPHVAAARKRDETLEALAERRERYAALAARPEVRVIDASQPPDAVLRAAAAEIWRARRRRAARRA